MYAFDFVETIWFDIGNTFFELCAFYDADSVVLWVWCPADLGSDRVQPCCRPREAGPCDFGRDDRSRDDSAAKTMAARD